MAVLENEGLGIMEKAKPFLIAEKIWCGSLSAFTVLKNITIYTPSFDELVAAVAQQPWHMNQTEKPCAAQLIISA